jgi:hypothetical protein
VHTTLTRGAAVPESAAIDLFLHVIVILFVSLMVLVSGYFVFTRFRPPKWAGHPTFVELYSSFVMLLCAAVARATIAQTTQACAR